MATQKDRVAQFRDLHDDLLVLPNAWDAASARMVQEAGGLAVATSSAALAWSNGYADDQGMPREVALAATREVLRAVTVPVTVDSEAGYSDDPAEVAAHVAALAALGVAGINLEDGHGAPETLAAKIAAIKASGTEMFINARCDVYLFGLTADDAKRDELIRRGKLYAAAGADGFFAPALINLTDIATVAEAVTLPLNILVMKGIAPVAELKAAGARRISAGALPGRAAYGAALKAAKMMLEEGRYDAIFAHSGDCPDFNKLFV